MSGEIDLNTLVANLSPSLAPDDYVFCTFEHARYGDFAEASPIAAVMEAEGLTLVVTPKYADAQRFAYQGSFKCITLNVHSSLAAVGLTAAVSTKLAQHGISANMVAGYFHDHIFVSVAEASRALALLESPL